MEKQRKRVNLEKAKIRFVDSGETSYWGEIANDFIIDTGETSETGVSLMDIWEKIPFIQVWVEDGIRYYEERSGITPYYVLRYRTMIEKMEWINSFIEESRFYRICYRKGELTPIEIDFDDLSGNVIMKEAIPEVVELGEQYWITDRGEDLMKKYSVSGETEVTNALLRMELFYNFANEHKARMGEETGFTDVHVLIEEEYDDLGIFTTTVKKWEKNKKYYLNDIVQDDYGYVYKLSKGDEIDRVQAPLVLYDFLSKELEKKEEDTCYRIYTGQDEIFTDVEHTYIEKDEKKHIFYYIKPYYKGEIDTEVQEYWTDTNNAYWRYYGFEEDANEEEILTGITESKLQTLRRSKKEYDDDSNELPFNVENGTAVIPYMKGIKMNVIKVGEVTYFDIISSIVENKEDKTFTFQYYVGSTEEEDGILYEETFPYEEKELTCNYNGKTGKTFVYKDIDYTSYNEGGKNYATIQINKERLKDDDFQFVCEYVKNENLIGLQKMSEEAEVNIERGKSAAFERHNILGEITSFEDLIKYKNGYFSLKNE